MTTNHELARRCHAAYAQTHDGAALTADTANADFETFVLMTAVFAREYREALQDGNCDLAVHLGDLLDGLQRHGAFAALDAMAGEG